MAYNNDMKCYRIFKNSKVFMKNNVLIFFADVFSNTNSLFEAINPVNTNPTKESNTLKQFVSNS